MPRKNDTDDTIARRMESLVTSLGDCLDAGNNVFTGPSLHFHKRTMDRLKELRSPLNAAKDDLFLNYLYATLTAWGMHRMGPKGAKMVAFEKFRDSLKKHGSRVQKLANIKVEQLDTNQRSQTATVLWGLINDIQISATESKVVAASKVLHHLLPNLVSPIDRTYTATFFVWKNRMQNNPEAMFRDVFPRLAELAKRLSEPAQKRLDQNFNTSLPKIVDNAIVGFVTLNNLTG